MNPRCFLRPKGPSGARLRPEEPEGQAHRHDPPRVGLQPKAGAARSIWKQQPPTPQRPEYPAVPTEPLPMGSSGPKRTPLMPIFGKGCAVPPWRLTALSGDQLGNKPWPKKGMTPPSATGAHGRYPLSEVRVKTAQPGQLPATVPTTEHGETGAQPRDQGPGGQLSAMSKYGKTATTPKSGWKLAHAAEEMLPTPTRKRMRVEPPPNFLHSAMTKSVSEADNQG